MRAGDQYVAYADQRPKSRLFITVTRVARDGSWADIVVQNWAVQWRKRQKVDGSDLPYAVPMAWGQKDLVEQEEDWDRARRDEAS